MLRRRVTILGGIFVSKNLPLDDNGYYHINSHIYAYRTVNHRCISFFFSYIWMFFTSSESLVNSNIDDLWCWVTSRCCNIYSVCSWLHAINILVHM